MLVSGLGHACFWLCFHGTNVVFAVFVVLRINNRCFYVPYTCALKKTSFDGGQWSWSCMLLVVLTSYKCGFCSFRGLKDK